MLKRFSDWKSRIATCWFRQLRHQVLSTLNCSRRLEAGSVSGIFELWDPVCCFPDHTRLSQRRWPVQTASSCWLFTKASLVLNIPSSGLRNESAGGSPVLMPHTSLNNYPSEPNVGAVFSSSPAPDHLVYFPWRTLGLPQILILRLCTSMT
jgi:hypothetical protein